jgi:hypothetical protein
MRLAAKQKVFLEMASKLKHLPADQAAMPHPFFRGKLLTLSDIEELHADIQSLSEMYALKFEPNQMPPIKVPALTAHKPKIEFHPVRISGVTAQLDRLFIDLDNQYIHMDDESVIEFSAEKDRFVVRHGNAQYGFTTPHALQEHLKANHRAYLIFKRMQGFVFWVPEEDANLMMAWEYERDQFAEQSSRVVDAFSKVSAVKDCAVALEQKKHLDAALPFAWTAGIRPTRGGLSGSLKSSGSGNVATTVTHLILKEDIQIGRLKRNDGDYLCAPSKGRLSKDLGVFIEEITVRLADGTEVKNVPIQITCEECRKKINALIK